MKLIKIILIILMFYLPLICMAEPTRNTLMHVTAHFGGVYTITYTAMDICIKITGKEHKLACTIGSAILANGANIAYKAEEKFPSDSTRSLTAGAAGSALAVGMIVLVW